MIQIVNDVHVSYWQNPFAFWIFFQLVAQMRVFMCWLTIITNAHDSYTNKNNDDGYHNNVPVQNITEIIIVHWSFIEQQLDMGFLCFKKEGERCQSCHSKYLLNPILFEIESKIDCRIQTIIFIIFITYNWPTATHNKTISYSKKSRANWSKRCSAQIRSMGGVMLLHIPCFDCCCCCCCFSLFEQKSIKLKNNKLQQWNDHDDMVFCIIYRIS